MTGATTAAPGSGALGTVELNIDVVRTADGTEGMTA